MNPWKNVGHLTIPNMFWTKYIFNKAKTIFLIHYFLQASAKQKTD
jgi:hypothetical protein